MATIEDIDERKRFEDQKRALEERAERLSKISLNIKLESLEIREYENLCFELVSQMGFQKVDWGLRIKEIDMVATLSKKDPDGYEYDELWLIVIAKDSHPELLFDKLMFDPDSFFEKLFRSDLLIKNKFRPGSDIPITLLFILKDEKSGFLIKDIGIAEKRLQNRKYPINIRIRIWNSNDLIKLIQTYPQIAFKYFSEQSQTHSRYRKTSEELNEENKKLTEQLLTVVNELQEEKRMRFIAERETAWKDVAFKAAHKLGNPVDAADTLLQGLIEKLNQGNIPEAKYRAELIDHEIEKTKDVISQFKSLTKIEDITLKPVKIENIINQNLNTAEIKGVKLNIILEQNLPEVFIDPDKTNECISELYANALHWFDKNKSEQLIEIKITVAKSEEIPEPLDNNNVYVKIIFQDNGQGINWENKEKIFSPFFTTYVHGSGLGLPLVKKIIEKQDGWIYENGKPGDGACFVIFLPVSHSK